jgi:hypothetical protein
MPVMLLIVAAVLFVAAYRNTAGDLGTALTTDVPPFLVWAGALLAVGALGYIPGMRQISRGLLVLVLIVLVLTNYQALFRGLSNVAPVQVGAAAVDPATAYALNPQASGVTLAGIQGTSGGNVNNVALAQPTTNPLGAFDPAAFLSAFESGAGGFGGVA